jgi:hypothetical protein
VVIPLLKKIAVVMPKSVTRTLVFIFSPHMALRSSFLQIDAWPDVFRTQAEQLVGMEEIPNGDQTLYKEIAERILAAVSTLGLERLLGIIVKLL